uniref:Polycystin domain-containing protein n=1 Tax=Alexandrium monilatum TaxID=311494 RepID=A0A7S4UEZ8_9DINO
MADGDARGAKDGVEGFDPREKKPLEKVGRERLHELKREQKTAEVKVRKELEAEVKNMMNLQTKLNDCNKDYADRKSELDELRDVQSEKLNASQKVVMTRLASRTVDSFLQRRNRAFGVEENVDVDVHYLPDVEAGLSLRTGGEGAGSRDATFPVRLSENVSSLTKRAATYWGLDAEKVFFLDRDGRVVFEDMSLREIILPPLHNSSSSSATAASSALALESGGSAPSGSGGREGQVAKFSGNMSDDGLDLAESMEQWTVAGRNYNLTLVRAVRTGPIPLGSNANKPKGDGWQDFTFDRAKLTQDLKDTMAKYGDPEFEVPKVDMNDIPSLFDLIQSGKQKKAMRRADTACRAIEFIIFSLAFVLFHLVFVPAYNWSVSMRLLSVGIEHSFLDFNIGERTALGIKTFYEISDNSQLEAWQRGPLKRSVLPTGLPSQNLFVLSLRGVQYEATPTQVHPPVEWCPAPTSAPAAAGAGSAPAGANASLLNLSHAALHNGTNGALHNGTNGTNATGAASAAGSTASTTAAALKDCSPVSLKFCPNTRVVDVFTIALQDGDLVPACRAPFNGHTLLMWWDSLLGNNPFTYIEGEVSTYFGGKQMVIKTTNESNFESSIAPMSQNVEVESTAARAFMIFVYTPTLNGLFVYTFLVENTEAGGLLATRRLQVVDLRSHYTTTVTLYWICIILAFICLALELRRVCRCYSKSAHHISTDRCSCWTLLFLFQPAAMIVSFSVFTVRFVQSTDEMLELDADMSLTTLSIDNVFQQTQMDYYNKLINVLVLVFLNLQLFRYALMYFPHLAFLTAMVSKLLKPLLYILLFSLMAFTVYANFLYVMFSSSQRAYSTFSRTIMEAIRHMMGGTRGWQELYNLHPTLFTVVHIGGFGVIQLMLNSMALAVMISHKKEKDLRQNYSYHRFWSAEISRKGGKSKEEFNPAMIGEKEKDARDHAR